MPSSTFAGARGEISWNGRLLEGGPAAWSLSLYARRLDNRPPFLDFSSVNGAERFRRLLLGRRNFHALIGDSPTYRRVGQCVHDSNIELGDDVPRRALGGPKRAPVREIKSWQSGLVHGQDFGGLRQSGLGGDGKGFDAPATHMWEGSHGVIDHHVNPPSHQILHRRGGPAIGHELKTGADHALKENAADVSWTTGAWVP